MKWIGIILCFGMQYVFAQPVVQYEEKSKVYAFEIKDQAEGTADELYARLKSWIQSQVAIQFEDHKRMFIGFTDDQYKLELLPTLTTKMVKDVAGKEVIEYVSVRYKLKVWVRNGEFRLRVSDLHTRVGMENIPIEKNWMLEDKSIKPEYQGIIDQFNVKVGVLAADIAQYMRKPPVVFNEDEW